MKLTPEQLEQRNAADRAAALRLLASPDGERLIAHLERAWLKRGPAPAANHGDAGWALAMFHAIADLKRLREEVAP